MLSKKDTGLCEANTACHSLGKASWRRVTGNWGSEMQHEWMKLNLSISIKVLSRQHRGQLALNVRDAAKGYGVRQREEILGLL